MSYVSQFLVLHPVKIIKQSARIGNQAGNGCWYRSAQMVLEYRRGVLSIVDTMNLDTLNRWVKNPGITGNRFKILAGEVGLQWQTGRQMVTQNTAEEWANALRKNGPLWVPTMPAANSGHIVVVCGVQADGTLWINDPWPSVPTPRKENVSIFGPTVCWGLEFLFKP